MSYAVLVDDSGHEGLYCKLHESLRYPDDPNRGCHAVRYRPMNGWDKTFAADDCEIVKVWIVEKPDDN